MVATPQYTLLVKQKQKQKKTQCTFIYSIINKWINK